MNDEILEKAALESSGQSNAKQVADAVAAYANANPEAKTIHLDQKSYDALRDWPSFDAGESALVLSDRRLSVIPLPPGEYTSAPSTTGNCAFVALILGLLFAVSVVIVSGMTLGF